MVSHGIEGHGADDGTTMDLLDALATASEEFTRQLAIVGDSDWSRSTPCSEWDVRYLVAHVVGGNRFAVSLLGGMSASDAMTEVMSTRQLSDDPLGDYIATSAAQLAAFRVDNPAEQRIDHPLGEITVREILGVPSLRHHSALLGLGARARRRPAHHARANRNSAGHRRGRTARYGFRHHCAGQRGSHIRHPSSGCSTWPVEAQRDARC